MYLKEKGKIIFDEFGGSGYNILNNVDFDSFEEISNTYGKDNNNIFSRSKIIKGIDVKNFKIIDENIIIDNNNLFLNGIKLDGININNYEIVLDYNNKRFNGYIPKSNFIKDDNIVYYNFSKLDECDAKNFKAIDFETGTDGNNIYYNNKIIKGVDINSFRVIKSGDMMFSIYADKNYVYEEGKRFKNSNIINDIKICKDFIFNDNSLEKIILIKDIRWLKYGKKYYNKIDHNIYNNKGVICNNKYTFKSSFFIRDKVEVIKDKLDSIYCIFKAIVLTIKDIISNK